LLAFLSDQSGRNEVYVVPFPKMNGKWQISTGGASSAPIWSPTGNELFYAEGGKLMKVDVTGGSNIVFSRPFVACSLPSLLFSLYDITNDGRRFLIAVSTEDGDTAPKELNVVVGWFSELQRKFTSLRK
jgi:hypothetical protein